MPESIRASSAARTPKIIGFDIALWSPDVKCSP